MAITPNDIHNKDFSTKFKGFDPEEVAYAIRRTNSYAFKRAVEPPFPDVNFYA